MFLQWSRAAYEGSQRNLVLAFDIGTTFSGISYSILDPGRIPKVEGVTKYPAYSDNSTTVSVSKIPTVIYYDKAGNVCAAGAETTHEDIPLIAKKEGWLKVEWFKLYLRPRSAPGRDVTPQLPPLPPNKTIVDVVADFFQYLYDCAAIYIQDSYGAELWASVANRSINAKGIHYVLTHPNGWEGKQQGLMRMAAIKAGLTKDSKDDGERLLFVTEGEASLHFAAQRGLLDEAIKKGGSVVIVDAGGGTIDVSTYRKKKTTSKDRGTFEEVAAPQSYFHGSVFVTILARVFLQSILAESEYIEDLDRIVRIFDTTTKLRFRDAGQHQYVKFGSTTDNEPNLAIQFGQLKLSGTDVAMFFKPSVGCVTHAILEQRKVAQKPISHVILVGGFSDSDWLFEQVKAQMEPLGLKILRPESQTSKAVADGAVSFYLDHFVRNRVSKFTYGVLARVRYDPRNKDHRKQKERSGQTLYKDKADYDMLENLFAVILSKSTRVSEEKQFRHKFYKASFEGFQGENAIVRASLWCYKGNKKTTFKDEDPENFTPLCTLEADVSVVPPVVMLSPSGREYYDITFEFVLYFGLTEMRAEIAWQEKGGEKRAPATILYDYGDISRFTSDHAIG
ncbi:hypothetical protein BDZ97DRAFT_697700 [Flammula alnicola]|nr:hypothetical protein BDZ97DRAFT_697700 [Flammula alnicola]